MACVCIWSIKSKGERGELIQTEWTGVTKVKRAGAGILMLAGLDVGCCASGYLWPACPRFRFFFPPVKTENLEHRAIMEEGGSSSWDCVVGNLASVYVFVLLSPPSGFPCERIESTERVSSFALVILALALALPWIVIHFLLASFLPLPHSIFPLPFSFLTFTFHLCL